MVNFKHLRGKKLSTKFANPKSKRPPYNQKKIRPIKGTKTRGPLSKLGKVPKHVLNPEQTQSVYESLSSGSLLNPFSDPLPACYNLTHDNEHTLRQGECALEWEHTLNDSGYDSDCQPEYNRLSNTYQDLLLAGEKSDMLKETEQLSQPTPAEIQAMNMTKWSILSNKLEYPASLPTAHSIVAKGITKSSLNNTPGTFPQCETDEHVYSQLQKDEYYDSYSEVKHFVHRKTHINDNHVSTTYLGTVNMNRDTVFHLEGNFSYNASGVTQGSIMDSIDTSILLDTGATRSFMGFQYYQKHKELHKLPKLTPQFKSIKVGNGERANVHFTIPVIVTVPSKDGSLHRFEIFTLVSDIKQDLVFGIKNCFELESRMDFRDSTFYFYNRSVPLFTKRTHRIAPGKTQSIDFEIPYSKELSGLTVLKLFDHHVTYTMQARITQNQGTLKLTNNSSDYLYINSHTALGIADIRSLGYYFIKHDTLIHHLNKIYTFQPLDQLCNAFNKMATDLYDKHAKHPDKTTPDAKTKHDNPIHKDPYPWLEPTDPRRHMTDEEIIRKFVDLSKSKLTKIEKEDVYQMLIKHKEAFSLRDEIGHCPNIEIDIDVIDDSPFFVRPFPIKEEDKPIMDRQMERLVNLGILSRNSTSHTSPVMLVTRKVTSDKRPVVDFRLLNTRILRRNTTTPLMKDIFNILGNSRCEVLSCCDLKDAFHSLKLTKKAKEFCGILPYFGSDHFRYEVMPMGLSISPCKWMEYVNLLLRDIQNRQSYIAIMDDLLIHSLKRDHMSRLRVLMKALIKHGLKLSPKKCQLFMTELVYMGNVFTIKDKRMTITPIKSRVDAIAKLPPPKTVKECKMFCGVVNYLSIFCPHLQFLLEPIYHLTKKGVPFHWKEKQDEAFKKIKQNLMIYPVLHLPIVGGRFILYCDTSRKHTGSTLWQIQDGQPRLIGYASKSLPSACVNYSVTELEMTGLTININMWKHLLHGVEFDCAVDHSAIPYIMKSKNEPPTKRIVRLLELLSMYSFNLYYVKGRDMVLCDYLSRVNVDPQEDPHKIIPISFTIQDILQEEYNSLVAEEIVLPHFNVATRSSTQKAGISMPAVHGSQKALDPHSKPEHDKNRKRMQGITSKKTAAQAISKKLIQKSKSLLRKNPIPRKTTLPAQHTPAVQNQQQVANPKNNNVPSTGPHSTSKIITKPNTVDDVIPFEPAEECQMPTAPQLDISSRPPNVTDCTHYPTLQEQLKTNKMLYKFLPKQNDLDKLLQVIQRKILSKTHLHTDLRDLVAAYKRSPHFKDIYNFLAFDKLPTDSKTSIKVEKMAKKFMIMDDLLYKIEISDTEHNALLCIPRSKVDCVLKAFHTSLGHAGITKSYYTISQRFFIPHLATHIRSYITSCHVCQLIRNPKNKRPFAKRMNIGIPALSRMSMDIKHMPVSSKGYKYLLVIMCETSHFVITAPMKHARANEVATILYNDVICYFGPPTHLICDQDPAFMAKVMQLLLDLYKIKLCTVSPTNHQSLQAEHGIKTISNTILKHLVAYGKNWEEHARSAMLHTNTYASPNMCNVSPYQCVFGKRARLDPTLEIRPDLIHMGTYKDLAERIYRQCRANLDMIEKFRSQRTDHWNKNRSSLGFVQGQIVYMYNPSGADIITYQTKKIKAEFVGPLAIYKAVSPNQFILMTLNGHIIPALIEESRLKPGTINTSLGPVNTLADLHKVMNAGKLV